MIITTTRIQAFEKGYALVTEVHDSRAGSRVMYQEYRVVDHATGQTVLDYETSFSGVDAGDKATMFMLMRMVALLAKRMKEEV